MARRKQRTERTLLAVLVGFVGICLIVGLLVLCFPPEKDGTEKENVLPDNVPQTEEPSSPAEPEEPVGKTERDYEPVNGEEYSTFPLEHGTEAYRFTQRLIEIARAEPAEAEDKNGVTKYGTFFGHPAAEWCTEFAVWCVHQTQEEMGLNYLDLYYPYRQSSGGCVEWFRDRGLFFRRDTYVPRRGDFIIFEYDGDGVTDHTGMVTGVEYDPEEDKLFILTIEGNLPEDWPVGVICERRLPCDSKLIYGYGTFLIPE